MKLPISVNFSPSRTLLSYFTDVCCVRLDGCDCEYVYQFDLLFIWIQYLHALISFSLFLLLLFAGYFWHITDLHFEPYYTTKGDIFRSKYTTLDRASKQGKAEELVCPPVVRSVLWWG